MYMFLVDGHTENIIASGTLWGQMHKNINVQGNFGFVTC